tara:strand:+ start:453 stop:956 length:504 start_codon:yes stop_codon:yes gene_type:complete
MSTLKVDSLVEKTSGNGVHIAGHVIQTQFYKSNTYLSTSGDSWSNTGYEINFTPKDANSILSIDVSLSGLGINNNGSLSIYFNIYKDGVAHQLLDTHWGYLPSAGSGWRILSGSWNTNVPATNISARTYSLYWRSTDTTGTRTINNYAGGGVANAGFSQMRIMEIAQ